MQADASAPVFATGEIEMAADPEIIWVVMADIARWPDWNPDITAPTVHGPAPQRPLGLHRDAARGVLG